jgi:hypothetical protein
MERGDYNLTIIKGTTYLLATSETSDTYAFEALTVCFTRPTGILEKKSIQRLLARPT